MSLTADNLKRFSNLSEMSQKLSGKTQEFFDIDENTRRFLSSNFDLHIDDANMKRSVTNFDRTVATKLFNKTNQSLKESHSYRMTQSGGFYHDKSSNTK
jgi:regulator of replication initiation timing